jgi:hypothetical protein
MGSGDTYTSKPNGTVRRHDAERSLAKLVSDLNRLCKIRAARVGRAEAAIARANEAFDRRAVLLSRRIAILRKTIDKLPAESVGTRHVRRDKHDPDWSQEDIDHYYELVRRGRSGK